MKKLVIAVSLLLGAALAGILSLNPIDEAKASLSSSLHDDTNEKAADRICTHAPGEYALAIRDGEKHHWRQIVVQCAILAELKKQNQ